jgi:hypothetical protein
MPRREGNKMIKCPAPDVTLLPRPPSALSGSWRGFFFPIDIGYRAQKRLSICPPRSHVSNGLQGFVNNSKSLKQVYCQTNETLVIPKRAENALNVLDCKMRRAFVNIRRCTFQSEQVVKRLSTFSSSTNNRIAFLNIFILNTRDVRTDESIS